MADSFFRFVNSPLRFRLFLFQKLPAAFSAGLRIEAADEETCSVSIRYRRATQNPFRSTYFACLSMAAEMSTGVLAMAQVYNRRPPVSMLVVEVNSKYYKKAVGKTIFICNDGLRIADAVAEAIRTGEPQAFPAHSIGYNEAKETVAEFWITWSFKAKKT